MLISHMATVFGHRVQCGVWRIADRAEDASSAAFSASCQNFFENVRVFPIVEPELKFRKVERQIFGTDFVVGAYDAALQQTPEILDAVRMDVALNVNMVKMLNGFVRIFS